MLRNYFKTAVRNLFRNKLFTLINIIGLSIGISAALVIFLIVQYDFSFDTFHKKGERTYRMVSVFNFSGEVIKNSGVTSPLGKSLRKEATGLELIIPFRIWNENQKVLVPASASNPRVALKNQKKIIFADAAYFNMLPYKWKAGSAAVSLKEPNQIVLTEKAAELYFPKGLRSDIIGKEIIFDDSIRTTVSGIVEDLNEKTDFNFTAFISLPTLEKASLKHLEWTEWNNTNGNSQLFVQLLPGTTPDHVANQANQLFDKNSPREKGDKSTHAFLLQPLSDLHFNADYGNFDQRTAHKPTLFGLLIVAAFLLILGCINFINLTTAQSSQRAREIGIRKTMGSSKKQLVLQFLSETFCITIIATLISLVFTPLLLKIFSDFIPPELHFDLLKQPSILLFLASLVIVVSFLAGFYPALVLSSLKPINTLKNQVVIAGGKSGNAWIRKGLTISQFTIAQFFILATLVVGQQIQYTLSKDLGFQKNAILYFSTNYRDTVSAHKELLAQKINGIPGVKMMSMSNGAPSSPNGWSSSMKYLNGKKEITTQVDLNFADTNYIKQFQLKVLAGSNIAAGDTVNQLFINETYAHVLGFQDPQEAIGKNLIWSNKQIPIRGVLADFHQKSLHEQIKPLAMGNWGKILRTFSITLQPDAGNGTSWKATIAKIEKAWKGIYPEEDFQYVFFDEELAKYYQEEQNISRLLKWATGLSVFISCLGLLGLVMYTTNQRMKEIGVRKVLGATVTSIVSLLSKDFLFLVMFAFLAAAPLAWWAMHKWLENFAYRTSMSIGLFFCAGLLTVLTALITICFQTIKAASANPVKSLRTE